MKSIIAKNYKKIISESNEDWDNGWNEDVREILSDTLNNIESLKYEIDHCVKGSFTIAKTHAALADYIRNLAENLIYAADQIENLPEDEENDENVDNASVKVPIDTDHIISDTKPFTNKINSNPPQFVVMVGRKYVMDDQITLTEDPNLAGKFNEDEADDIKDNLKLKAVKAIDTKELFTDNKFDQDKANIYFKYNQIYESRQKEIKRKLVK